MSAVNDWRMSSKAHYSISTWMVFIADNSRNLHCQVAKSGSLTCSG